MIAAQASTKRMETCAALFYSVDFSDKAVVYLNEYFLNHGIQQRCHQLLLNTCWKA